MKYDLYREGYGMVPLSEYQMDFSVVIHLQIREITTAKIKQEDLKKRSFA